MCAAPSTRGQRIRWTDLRYDDRWPDDLRGHRSGAQCDHSRPVLALQPSCCRSVCARQCPGAPSQPSYRGQSFRHVVDSHVDVPLGSASRRLPVDHRRTPRSTGGRGRRRRDGTASGSSRMADGDRMAIRSGRRGTTRTGTGETTDHNTTRHRRTGHGTTRRTRKMYTGVRLSSFDGLGGTPDDIHRRIPSFPRHGSLWRDAPPPEAGCNIP